VSRSLKAHVLLVLATIVWGATFVLIKAALADISPLLFNSVRMALAAVCLLVIFRKEMKQLTRGALVAGSVVGVSLWMGYGFQTAGLKLTTASRSAFITCICVVLVPLLLAIAWRRGVRPWTAAGVAIVVVGLYLLTMPSSGFDFSSINRGDLLTLGAAAAFALEIILLGRATGKYSYQQITTVMIAVCALLMFPSVPLFETPHVVWSPAVIWALLITAVFATVLAFIVQAWAQQFTPPTHTALIVSLEPVFAWLTALAVRQEQFSARATSGAVLIMAGVLVSELRGGSAPAQEPAGVAEMAD
jgi:drug/metabolite transporter (DMT)-like permease